MTDEKPTVSTKQRRALEALALGMNATDAAHAAGVNRSTLYVWLRQDAFAAELAKLQDAALGHLARRLLALSDDAATALQDALQPGQPITARIRAASIVSERGPSLAELTNILRRLEALEQEREV